MLCFRQQAEVRTPPNTNVLVLVPTNNSCSRLSHTIYHPRDMGRIRITASRLSVANVGVRYKYTPVKSTHNLIQWNSNNNNIPHEQKTLKAAQGGKIRLVLTF